MVLYLVVSCDCFVIIMFPGKESLSLDMIYCVTVHFCIIVHTIVIEASKKLKSSMKY